ncbi:unnamed protein product, partial [Amoebophrya sp. A25]
AQTHAVALGQEGNSAPMGDRDMAVATGSEGKPASLQMDEREEKAKVDDAVSRAERSRLVIEKSAEEYDHLQLQNKAVALKEQERQRSQLHQENLVCEDHSRRDEAILSESVVLEDTAAACLEEIFQKTLLRRGGSGTSLSGREEKENSAVERSGRPSEKQPRSSSEDHRRAVMVDADAEQQHSEELSSSVATSDHPAFEDKLERLKSGMGGDSTGWSLPPVRDVQVPMMVSQFIRDAENEKSYVTDHSSESSTSRSSSHLSRTGDAAQKGASTRSAKSTLKRNIATGATDKQAASTAKQP